MSSATKIQVDRKLVSELKKAKKYKMQTYSELIRELLESYRLHGGQYDKYLHTIQQTKMKELWDNKDDGDWDNV